MFTSKMFVGFQIRNACAEDLASRTSETHSDAFTSIRVHSDSFANDSGIIRNIHSCNPGHSLSFVGLYNIREIFRGYQGHSVAIWVIRFHLFDIIGTFGDIIGHSAEIQVIRFHSFPIHETFIQHSKHSDAIRVIRFHPTGLTVKLAGTLA